MQRDRVDSVIIFDSYHGWSVEWYKEGSNGEVWVQRWYGDFDECEDRKKSPPDDKDWIPVTEIGDGSPPYDAATATGMYDD